jgi:pimeloyl-ACP methyl ester carboxylesterase
MTGRVSAMTSHNAETPTVQDRWTHAGEVGLHYLDNTTGSAELAPVLVIPGFGERAEEYRWLLDALAGRRALAMSARGRGQSDAPTLGYRWEDHIDDIEAVIGAAEIPAPIIVAFSRGSSYAYGYALRHPGGVQGLVIGDYPARHVGLPPSFVTHQLTASIRGVPMSERMPAHAIAGVQAESVEVALWERLAELKCRVLLIRGGRPGTMIDDAGEQHYRDELADIEVAMLERAGHDLWSRDPEAFYSVLAGFLARIDSAG